jgi:2-polyprenyl-3-methyl-5-hydroxy-6-metoxy-1,4-benzoquinol methylase
MTLTNDNYGIRADYVAHTANRTVDSDAGILYWSPYQIKMASHYQYHVYQAAQALMRRESLRTVLDIGCGPALKLAELIVPAQPAKIVGLDEPNVMLFARSHVPTATFMPYDIEREQFPLQETFDLIISSDVIEHLVNPDKLLNDIRQASTPTSWIVLSTPERDALRGRNSLSSPKAVHVREWNKEEFAAYLTSRGFTVIEQRLLPPLRFNWTRAYFRQWLGQLQAGRPFNTCQMIICKKA